jgi:tetratricopeptide (TPR) repeat protein
MKTAGRFGSIVVVALACAAAAPLAAGCSRNNIEAVNLANEADKAKATNIDEAISKYEQATTLDPMNHRILWKLALAYTKKEQWEKVSATCVKAQKVAPTFANYYFQQGLALARIAQKGPNGNWSDAKGPLEEAIQKDAGLWDAHFELAEVLLHLDDEQGALREYTKAVEAKPDELAFYIPLADLYIRLGYIDEAEKVVKEGLSFGKEGDKFLFGLHSLMGQILEARQPPRLDDALKEYELAKRACGQCSEPGQAIAFFNLGAAYAQVSPPQKSQAMQNLQAFQKTICKGAAAARYAEQCSQAQQLASKMGGTLQ